MVVDITLASIFIVSFGLFWYRVAQKIPALVAIPDEVISQKIRQDSAKFWRIFFRLRELYHERRLRQGLLVFWGKLLYRLHIVFMHLDNAVVGRLKKIRENTGLTMNGNGGNGKSTTSPQIISQKLTGEVRSKDGLPE